MPRKLSLPDSPAMPEKNGGDARLFAPSAARNLAPILELLQAHAPHQGKALEIASGSGEHIAAFARALPNLRWQPSDPDPKRRASVVAHCQGLNNTRPALPLDASTKGWSAQLGGQDLIVLINLLHLISLPETRQLLAEVALALAPGGIFFLYGPFLRDGNPTSQGDREFDASLRRQDPEIGYKDDWDIIEIMHENWLELIQVVEMPANNLALIARRPS